MKILILLLLALLTFNAQAELETWRGLVIADENRCTPYHRYEYPYKASLEFKIAENLGGYYVPYTDRWFEGPGYTDIEHIVAISEAHDSGLCAADKETKRKFSNDLLNLTLAGATVNRVSKSDKDAAEWLPPKNTCWFAGRVVKVRKKYSLTVDKAEADALEGVLSKCESIMLEMTYE